MDAEISHTKAVKLIRHLAIAAKKLESKRSAKLEVRKGIDRIKEVLQRPVERSKLDREIEHLEAVVASLIDKENEIFNLQETLSSQFNRHVASEKKHFDQEDMLRKALQLQIEREQKEIQLIEKQLKSMEAKHKELSKKYPKNKLAPLAKRIKSSQKTLKKLKNKKKKR